MDDGDVVATLKILVVGDSGTGKSCLLTRFIDDVFDPDQGPTIGSSALACVARRGGLRGLFFFFVFVDAPLYFFVCPAWLTHRPHAARRRGL
jgi:hypothetical protein